MRITVLSGGVGGSRFVQGLLAAAPDADVTVVVNTADDVWMHGLRVSPDLDTAMYTLTDAIDPERGWGRRDETWHAKEELEAYGAEQAWFGLGDRDLATHLVRSMVLREGGTLSDATRRLCERWQPPVTLLPMSDDEVETHIATTVDGADVEIHFQEFWIRHRAQVPVHAVEVHGLADAVPAPGVVEAVLEADVVVLPPSNPIVSVGPILGVRAVGEAVRTTRAPVVGVSPIIGGAAVRGMADQLLTGLGIELSAGGVARHLGARRDGGVLDGWLVDASDADHLPGLDALGVVGRAVPLWMRDPATTRRLAEDTLALADELRG
ncbi:2-phospho-L-lactate transferase [Aeromicrobium sp. Root495]|uniref:2-phospho-L-lactate transferase n=1 Tax=Aeromicrobium sp. Root495 TaxID=1736550 RepID=UPI0006FF0AE8|nr:2-phospho-L-lactate transferase [Aeromicrobium sp. Root495]KQY56160.1 2-phospho-L-lactate transferase [Aeromicrobium sp. Root495]